MNKIKKIIAVLLTVLTMMGVFSSATTVIAADFSETQARKAYFNENLSGYLKNIINTDDAEKIAEKEMVDEVVNANKNIDNNKTNSYSSASSFSLDRNQTKDTEDAVEDLDIDHSQLTLELENGSESAYMFSEPISFIDENGNLKYKDTNIQELSDETLNRQGYTYENGINDYKIYFGSNSEDGVMINNPDDVAVKITPISSVSANGEVIKLLEDGKEIDAFLYNGVYDSSTALRYTPQLNGLKEEIVINSYTGKTEYDFYLYTANKIAAINSYGDIEIIDPETKEITETFKAPFAYDSSGGFDETSEHYSDCEYVLEEMTDGKYKLTVIIPADYLSAETTEYPIIIDPVTSHISMTYDTSVYSAYSTSSFSSNTTACFGRTSSSEYGRGRAHFYFKIPSDIEKYAKISSAKLYLRETTGRTDTMYVRPYVIKDTWSNSVTWETRPAYTTSISYPGKSGLALPRRNINSTSTDISDSSYWYAFNITYAVRAWTSGTINNRGLVFIAECDSGNTDYLWRAFATKENATSSYRPYTVINYTNDVTKPTISSVSGNPTSYTNKNVTLTVTATDETYGIYRYSFDNGTTWQASNSKTFSSNQTVKIKVKDYAGNVSDVKSVSITKIDKTAPVATFTYGEVGDNYTPVDVTIKLSDNCGLKSYSIDGDPAITASGTSKTINTTCDPGFEYTLVVTDTAGNTKTVTYGIDYPYPDDLEAPVAPDLFEEDGKIYVKSRSFNFNEETDSEEFFQVDIGLYRYAFHEPEQMAVDVVHTNDITVEAWLDDVAGNMGDSSTIIVKSKIGEYTNSYNDIALGEKLLPVGFERTYSSKDGWFFNFESSLAPYTNGFVFTDFYGDKHHYISDANGEYFSVDGDQLFVENGTLAGKSYSYKLEYDGLTLYFDSSKKLAIAADEYNTAIYSYTDSAITITNKLKSGNTYTNAVTATVTLSNGKPVIISVSPVSSTESRTVQYTWSGNNLTSFTDALGTVHNYTYTNGLLTNDDGITIDYSNGRVKRITQKNGAFVKYTYNDNAESVNGFYDNKGAVTISDSKGVTDTFNYSEGIIISENGFNYSEDALYAPTNISNSLTTDTISNNLHYFVEETPDGEESGEDEPSQETEETSDLYDKYDDGSYTFYQYDENGRVIASLEVAAGALTVTDSTTFADAEAVAESKTITIYASEIDDDVIEEIILERKSNGELENTQRTTYSYNENGALAMCNSFTWLSSEIWYLDYSEEYSYNAYGNTIEEISTVYTLVPTAQTGVNETVTDVTITQYIYDVWNQLVETTTSKNSVITDNYVTEYDSLGRTVSKSSNEYEVSYEYDSNGNATSYTENGEETIYNYAANGNLTSRTNPNGSVASYTYDSYGNLTNHSFNGYSFTYNTLGSILTANSNTQQLASYTYSQDTKQDVLFANYGNGQNISYVYNSDGEITDIKLGNSSKYSYQYFSETVDSNTTEWTELTDYVNGLNKVLEENKTTVKNSNGDFIYSVENILSDDGSVTGEKLTVGNTEYTVDFGENVDTFKTNGTQNFTKSYTKNNDGEIVTETLSTGVLTEYGYNSNSAISTLENILDDITLEYSYGYNGKGNITAETVTRRTFGEQGETIDSAETTVYNYDNKGQLTSAENDSTKWEYTYNGRGNILTSKEYSVSVNDNGEKVYTLKTDGNNTFVYGNTWQDMLTSFNGESITYDAIGNPLSYKGNTLTWTMGRQLSSYGSNTYKYNEDGIRTSKTVDDVTTQYYLNGTDIIQQSDGTNTLYFYYDNASEVVGFNYNNNDYFYVKNMMDDIVAIVDSTGTVVAEYTYSPWGEVTSVTGSNVTLGELNPFRYRSYYYDSDIEMYYLQSRYYDPEICRFINCDDVNYIGVTESEVSYNPFAYCLNNPANNVDSNGTLAQCIIGAMVSGIIAFVLYYVEYYLGMRKWNTWTLIAIVAFNAAIGAFTWYWGLGGKIQNLKRLGGVLQNLKMVNSGIVKLFKIIKWVTKGIKFIVNMVVKKFTRYPGESWYTVTRRVLGKATGVYL